MKGDGYYCSKRDRYIYDHDSYSEEFWADMADTPVAMLNVTARELYSLFKAQLKEELSE